MVVQECQLRKKNKNKDINLNGFVVMSKSSVDGTSTEDVSIFVNKS